MKLFMVRILKPLEKVFDGMVQRVEVPTTEGIVGLLSRHIPYAAALNPGDVTILTAAGDTQTFSCQSGGSVQFYQDTCTVLLQE